jgi:hypothetical protein
VIREECGDAIRELEGFIDATLRGGDLGEGGEHEGLVEGGARGSAGESGVEGALGEAEALLELALQAEAELVEALPGGALRSDGRARAELERRCGDGRGRRGGAGIEAGSAERGGGAEEGATRGGACLLAGGGRELGEAAAVDELSGDAQREGGGRSAGRSKPTRMTAASRAPRV